MLKVLIMALFVILRNAYALDFNSLNQFSMKMIYAVYAFENPSGLENFGISTVSLWNVFTVIADGAAGATFDELIDALNLPQELWQTKNMQCSTRNVLKSRDVDVNILGKTAMFVEENTNVHREFCLAAMANGNDMYTVNNGNKTLLAEQLSRYICTATHGYIKQPVNAKHLEDIKLMLVDAMYFKADWTYMFDKRDTKEMQFYNQKGKPIGYTNLMFQKVPVEIGYIDFIEATTIELSFGKNKRYSFLILISLKNIVEILERLSEKPTEEWLHKKTNVETKEIAIPRLKISTDVNLIKELRYLGVIKLFDRDKATLPGISNDPVYISNVMQKVVLELTEDGVSAFSGTIKSRALSEPIIVNSPFVYFVLERETRVIIFGGVYNKPEVF